MPIIKFERTGGYSWAVWEVTETIEELQMLSLLTKTEEAEFAAIKHEIKRKEYLAGRLALKAIVEDRRDIFKGINKDACGKPFLLDNKAHISLSHSFPFAGAILHTHKPTGIDIEKPQGKLLAIASKFLSEKEKAAAGDDLKKLCVYWCAKETLYKIYGRKQVIFNEHLAVDSFLMQKEGLLKGYITIVNHEKAYQLRYIFFKEVVMCFNV